jgi:hypothetical protein
MESFENEAASLVEDRLTVFDVADNVDWPDLATRYAGVTGVLCDVSTQVHLARISRETAEGFGRGTCYSITSTSRRSDAPTAI